MKAHDREAQRERQGSKSRERKCTAGSGAAATGISFYEPNRHSAVAVPRKVNKSPMVNKGNHPQMALVQGSEI